MLIIPIFLTLFAICHSNYTFSDRARYFSSRLMSCIVDETESNSVMSPLGVWSLLTGVSMGATGESKKQIRRSLKLPKNNAHVIEKYKKFINKVIVHITEDVEFKSNTFLFADEKLDINSEFLMSMNNDFDVNVTRLNFTLSQKAAVKANTIIQQTTNITNVLRSENFKNSRMILTNVISFKGLWRSPFDSESTRVEPFYDENKNMIGEVNMMQQQDFFQVSNIAELYAMVLELPYGKDERYSFFVLLPKPKEKLYSVFRALKTFTVKDIIERMQQEKEEYDVSSVFINLPRFKINTNMVLNRPLQRLNIIDIFDPHKASFRLLSDKDKLYVSSVVQNAEIEVTESGTTASAATSAFFADRSLPYTYNANKPFMYMIVEKSSATVIFSGVYSKPTLY